MGGGEVEELVDGEGETGVVKGEEGFFLFEEVRERGGRRGGGVRGGLVGKRRGMGLEGEVVINSFFFKKIHCLNNSNNVTVTKCHHRGEGRREIPRTKERASRRGA